MFAQIRAQNLKFSEIIQTITRSKKVRIKNPRKNIEFVVMKIHPAEKTVFLSQ